MSSHSLVLGVKTSTHYSDHIKTNQTLSPSAQNPPMFHPTLSKICTPTQPGHSAALTSPPTSLTFLPPQQLLCPSALHSQASLRSLYVLLLRVEHSPPRYSQGSVCLLHPSDLYSKVTFSVRLPLTMLHKTEPPSSFPTSFFLP